MPTKSHRRGFTLMEIIVVLVVVAILAALVAPNVFQHVDDAKETAAKSQIEMLGGALDTYRLHSGHYPTTAEGLAALWEPPAGTSAASWRGPYLRREPPLDPWGNAYRYLSPGEVNARSYDLVSLGADGKPGGEGPDRDITSW
jgi:general secretion pathway protein G